MEALLNRWRLTAAACLATMGLLLAGCGQQSGEQDSDSSLPPAPTPAIEMAESEASPTPAAAAEATTEPAETPRAELVLTPPTGPAPGRETATTPTTTPSVSSAPTTAAAGTIPEAQPVANASSAYVRAAAESPIQWQQWAPATFARAKAEGKPLLISIGANWCPWCLLMDASVYKDQEVADLINESFIAIKVDADERPDINERYQAAHFLINRQGGGWPLTVFALPDGRAFESLTYVPLKATDKQAGMAEILKQVTEVYSTRKADAEKQAELVEAGVARTGLDPAVKSNAFASAARKIQDSIKAEYDSANGGFSASGDAKFPNAGSILFLLHHHSDTGDKDSLDMAVRSLTAYYTKGLRDHVHGGFFRYTSDKSFTKPHFEKKLHVQAELLSAYALAYAATERSLLKEAGQDILKYTRYTLENPGGGFYASQASDASAGDDGAFYRYTAEQVNELTDDESAAKVFISYLNIGEGGNEVPYSDSPLRETATAVGVSYEAAQKALNEARASLHKARTSDGKMPYVDKTIIASWNALMISAYLDAYRYLGDEEAKAFALKTADFILTTMVSETEGIARVQSRGQSAVYGILEDQVMVAQALIDCFQVSGNREYLDTAISLMEFVEATYRDAETGLYRDYNLDGEKLGLLSAARLPVFDNPTASPNGQAAITWYHIYQATQDEKHEEITKRLASAVAGQEGFVGSVAGTYGQALLLAENGAPKALIIGNKDDSATLEMHEAALGVFRPGKLVEVMTPEEAKSTDYPPSEDGSVFVYVCTAANCAPPTGEQEKVVDLLKTFGRGSASTESTED